MSTRYRGYRIIAGREIGWRIPSINVVAMNLSVAVKVIDFIEGGRP